MDAVTDLCFLSVTICSAVWPHVTRRRVIRSFALILLGSLGVFAFAWSAISPEDDVFQHECIRRRIPSRMLNKSHESLCSADPERHCSRIRARKETTSPSTPWNIREPPGCGRRPLRRVSNGRPTRSRTSVTT
jgi:hypothetical protein